MIKKKEKRKKNICIFFCSQAKESRGLSTDASLLLTEAKIKKKNKRKKRLERGDRRERERERGRRERDRERLTPTSMAVRVST